MKNKLFENKISIDMEDIVDYDFPLDEPFALEIIHKGCRYDFIIRLSSSNENLICFGSGATTRNRTDSKGQPIVPPFLNRWSYYGFLDESCIAYADPTFFKDEDITLGWYVGGEDWYLKIISDIIKKICINRNIKHDNILCFGSSGGGFASIGLAALIKDSKALVNNSSFDVRDISKAHYNNLLKFLQKEFKGMSEEAIWELIKHRLNLNTLFKKLKYVPEMCIYINIASPSDFQKRMVTFTNYLFKNPYFRNNLTLQYYYETGASSKGHNALIHNNEKKVLKLFARAYLYNEKKEVDSYLKLLDCIE